MPLYEFRCHDCKRKSVFSFTYAEYGQAEPTCPHCQSQQLRRLISRVALAKSEDSRLDAMADDSLMAGLDEEDPQSTRAIHAQNESGNGRGFG